MFLGVAEMLDGTDETLELVFRILERDGCGEHDPARGFLKKCRAKAIVKFEYLGECWGSPYVSPPTPLIVCDTFAAEYVVDSSTIEP